VERPNLLVIMADQHAPQFSGPYGHPVVRTPAMEQTGQAQNTVVIYTADHGEMLGEHGLWQKCCFYEHSVRIPLVVRWPGRLAAGSRLPQLVSLVDLTTTLVDLAGVPAAPQGVPPAEGRSLVPLLKGEDPDPPEEVFSEFYANFSTAPMAMLRRGRFKLNWYHGEPPELYDLEMDPGETRNLAETEPAVVEELRERLFRRWNPDDLEQRVRASQAERRYLQPYLFGYLD
jgi:choline-sulfatase